MPGNIFFAIVSDRVSVKTALIAKWICTTNEIHFAVAVVLSKQVSTHLIDPVLVQALTGWKASERTIDFRRQTEEAPSNS